MSKNVRKYSKRQKRAGLGKKWWRRFESEKEYNKALAKWKKENNISGIE